MGENWMVMNYKVKDISLAESEKIPNGYYKGRVQNSNSETLKNRNADGGIMVKTKNFLL